jgi:hypothetical protein
MHSPFASKHWNIFQKQKHFSVAAPESLTEVRAKRVSDLLKELAGLQNTAPKARVVCKAFLQLRPGEGRPASREAAGCGQMAKYSYRARLKGGS